MLNIHHQAMIAYKTARLIGAFLVIGRGERSKAFRYNTIASSWY